jgi:cyclic pyranopterin phosphate synthase
MTRESLTPGLALRIGVTDRCQLRCRYCRPGRVLERNRRTDILRAADIVRFVRLARRAFGVAKVRLTGGEPLLRRDIVELVAQLGQLGLPDLTLTSNGQRLAALAKPLRAAGLHRINVSLDSLDAGTFTRVAQGGDLSRTLDGIEAARAAGLAPLRTNTVVMRGINDQEAEAIVAFALARGCEPRFIELMPSGLADADYRRWFVSSDELRERLAQTFALAPEPHVPGSSSRRWRVASTTAREIVGFISPNSHPFCSGCRRLRLTADGRLLGCLGRAEHIRLLRLLRANDHGSDERIVAAMQVALACKRGTGAFAVATPMSLVGG